MSGNVADEGLGVLGVGDVKTNRTIFIFPLVSGVVFFGICANVHPVTRTRVEI